MSTEPLVDFDFLFNGGRHPFEAPTLFIRDDAREAATERWNAQREYAQSVADSNKTALAAEYRSDLARCTELLTEWLREPEGQQAIRLLLSGDDCAFGMHAIVALDHDLLELAWQDIYDEQMGNL